MDVPWETRSLDLQYYSVSYREVVTVATGGISPLSLRDKKLFRLRDRTPANGCQVFNGEGSGVNDQCSAGRSGFLCMVSTYLWGRKLYYV